jgi:hypothetical protein
MWAIGPGKAEIGGQLLPELVIKLQRLDSQNANKLARRDNDPQSEGDAARSTSA